MIGAGKGGFGGGGGSSNRNVTYKIGVEADPNAKRVMDDLAKSATNLEKKLKSIGDGSKKNVDPFSKGLGEAAKQAEKINRHMADAAKGRATWERGLSSMAKENTARLREQERATERLARQQSLSMNQMKRAQKDVNQGFDMMVGGLTRVGRAVALAGVIGEKDMQKLLNTLLGVQVASDAINGGLGAYRGLQKAIGGSRAFRAASGGGGFASNAAANAAGNLAAGGVTSRLAAPAGLWGLAAAGVTFGAVSGGSAIRDAFKHGPGRGATPGSINDSVSTALWRTNARIGSGFDNALGIPESWSASSVRTIREEDRLDKRIAAGRAGRQAAMDAGAGAAALSGYQRNFLTGRADLAGQQSSFGMTGAEGQAAFLTAQRQSLMAPAGNVFSGGQERAAGEALLENDRQRLALARQLKETRISGAQAELDIARQTQQAQQSEGQSVLSRLGNMDPGKQQLVKQLGPMFMSGKWMPPELMGVMREAYGGVQGFEERDQAFAAKRALDAGLLGTAELFRNPDRERAAAGAVADAQVTVHTPDALEIRITGGLEVDDLIEKMRPQLQKFKEEWDKAAAEAFKQMGDKAALGDQARWFQFQQAQVA